ncbi:hypothetical protein KC319_g2 [Hortaea werneckii]|nr:hypothetical protein KC319_g2 [Hortaea werneckii]
MLSRRADKPNPLYSSACHSQIPTSEWHRLGYLLRLSILPGLTIGIDAFPSKRLSCGRWGIGGTEFRSFRSTRSKGIVLISFFDLDSGRGSIGGPKLVEMALQMRLQGIPSRRTTADLSAHRLAVVSHHTHFRADEVNGRALLHRRSVAESCSSLARRSLKHVVEGQCNRLIH